ncbi:UNVERIFIED_CONTAM: SPX domain-containing protein 4 [Sesamum latifolium]|uniref:SPX domain-containing protein 4 n=1 Tax=Sesamum latifolium TaxID=2727402 RepID=A0AAW2XBZ9_9LAMI
MKFGKEFYMHLARTIPDWRDKYLCYKLLKKLLKTLPPPRPCPCPCFVNGNMLISMPKKKGQKLELKVCLVPPGSVFLLYQLVNVIISTSEKLETLSLTDTLFHVLEYFSQFNYARSSIVILQYKILLIELFGVVFLLFLVVTEAIKQKLKRRIEQLKERGNYNGVFTSETEFSEDMTDIRKGFVAIHGEMILLQNYSSLNFAGLVKIVKKYDKRTGELLSLPFSLLASNQPFLTTEPLSRLVYECEANRETLFPPKQRL